MKHLIPLLLLSLNSFSQAPGTTQPLRQFDKIWTSGGRTLTIHPGRNGDNDTLSFDIRMRPKIDTIRAELLVTMCRKCAAEAIPGYVVIEKGKRPVYLDCRKRALKGSQVGWGYELVTELKMK